MTYFMENKGIALPEKILNNVWNYAVTSRKCRTIDAVAAQQAKEGNPDKNHMVRNR